MRITSEHALMAAAAVFGGGLTAPLIPFLPEGVAPLLMLASIALSEAAVRMDARRA